MDVSTAVDGLEDLPPPPNDPLSRKRLRNRIAQRKYRKKQQQWVEELEVRANAKTVEGSLPTPASVTDAASRPRSARSELMAPARGPPPLTEATASSHVAAHATPSHGADAFDIYLLKHGLSPAQVTEPNRDMSAFVNARHGLLENFEAAYPHIYPATSGAALPATTAAANAYRACTLSGEMLDRAPADLRLESRIAFVTQAASTAGFPTLDAAILAYYTTAFESGSALHRAQKLSRNRHLPNLLHQLRTNSDPWTAWEKTGYRNEIIRSAEHILIQEFETFLGGWYGHAHPAGIATPASAEQNSSVSHAAERLEDKIPNLWAIIMALMSSDSIPDQQRRRQQLLDIISSFVLADM